MRELSLHILDLAQNSLTANATRLDILIRIDHEKDNLSITLADNGKGMAPDFLKSVTSPFTTTRTTRKVGLGIPMFKANAELTARCEELRSELDKISTAPLRLDVPSALPTVPFPETAAQTPPTADRQPKTKLEHLGDEVLAELSKLMP